MFHDHSSLIIPPSRPRLVGIVNITTDSFSDGGRFLATEDALKQAWRLHEAGADIIELGPAASHPGAQRVTAAEEIRRLAGLVEELVAARVPVMIDSYLPETQRFAAARGATYLNDIQGFPDPERYAELADTGCGLVVMHSVQRRGPATAVRTDPRTVQGSLEQFFRERLLALQTGGIDHERLIIDPGIGHFLGNTPEPSLRVLTGLKQLKAEFGVPVLISPSKKSFLRALTGRSVADVGPATLAAELYAASQGADFIRTHDVAAIGDALTIFAALSEATRSADQ